MDEVAGKFDDHPSRGSGKIDKELFAELLLTQKWSQKQIASFFGVGESAISQMKSRLQLEVNRHIGLFDGAAVLDAQLAVASNISGLSQQTKELLEMINLVLHGSRSEDKKKRTAAWEAKVKLSQLLGSKGNLATMLASLQGELRKQTEFIFNMQKEIYSLKQVEFFQRTVLEAIQEESPETAQRIAAKLVEVQATRSSLDFGGGSEV